MVYMELNQIRAYLHDRVKELRNQVPNGDPFVFLGMSTVMTTLNSLNNNVRNIAPNQPGPSIYKFVADERLRPVMSNAMFDISSLACRGFKEGVPSKIRLSHVDTMHLTIDERVVNSNVVKKVIISANPMLDALDQIIEGLFNDIESDQILKAKAFIYFNSGNKLFGYN